MKKLTVIYLGLMLSLPLSGIAAAQAATPANAAATTKAEQQAAAKAEKLAAQAAKKAAQAAAKAEKLAAKKAAQAAAQAAKDAAKKAARGVPKQDPAVALAAQAAHTETLLANPKVVGTAVSWNSTGNAVVTVYVAQKPVAGEIPKTLNGVPVVVSNIGTIYALNVPCEQRPGKNSCQGAVDTSIAVPTARDRQPRPVPIGVSVGGADMAGTLGCRVSRGCHNFALTNSHVVGTPGSTQLLQPAAYDGGNDPADSVGAGIESVPIVMGTSAASSNRVDAAIYAVEATSVGTATLPNGYGEPRMATLNPALNMDVMKYGRSSSKTSGYIEAINATLIVRYPSGDARFIDQIVIRSATTSAEFSLPGDSGSLVVAEGGADARKPVGLLFASGNGVSIANPINDVLFELDVDIAGAHQ